MSAVKAILIAAARLQCLHHSFISSCCPSLPPLSAVDCVSDVTSRQQNATSDLSAARLRCCRCLVCPHRLSLILMRRLCEIKKGSAANCLASEAARRHMASFCHDSPFLLFITATAGKIISDRDCVCSAGFLFWRRFSVAFYFFV